MRFSIKALLAATALVAVSISGLLYANAVWAAAFFTGVFLFLLFGVVAAFIGKGATRAYWIGFVVFGSAYFLFSIFVDFQPNMDRGRVGTWNEPLLLTTDLLLRVDHYLVKLRPARNDGLMWPGTAYMPHSPPSATFYRMTFFSRGPIGYTLIIGHSVFTILVGLAGSWTGSWFYRRELAA